MRNEQSGYAGKHNRLYKTWHAMINRCSNQNYKNYRRYGGRGIFVCKEWESFVAFCDWALVNGYSDTKTIDRENNDLGYSPENCAWKTPKQQARNRSDNVLFEYNGESLCLPEWAERYGIKVITLVCRVKRMGWTIERALTEPVRQNNPILEARGDKKHLSDWAKEVGMRPDALYLRIRRGWDVENAIFTPIRTSK